MVIDFTPDSSGKAVLVAQAFNGWLIVWGVNPFWVGKDKASLESPSRGPTGSNVQKIDGVYIPSPSGGATSTIPLALPWNGDVYVMNGKGALDNGVNSIFITFSPLC